MFLDILPWIVPGLIVLGALIAVVGDVRRERIKKRSRGGYPRGPLPKDPPAPRPTPEPRHNETVPGPGGNTN